MKVCSFCQHSFEPTKSWQTFCSPPCKYKGYSIKYKDSNRKSNIKYKYGISWDEWMEMYDSQEGKCLICKKFCSTHPEHKRDGLCVDHCHTTGKVRGLLCVPCNSAIGQLRDDPKIIEAALMYILDTSKRESKKK